MATITLKNIPDDLYEHLKVSAQVHHRSVNSEVINCLEVLLKPKKVSAKARLARIRNARPQIDPEMVSSEDIQRAINEGRP
ncbi:Arc family DNA-binding protein [bacterium AH-315-K03]|nr:Arc family DNA-binding protein [bacterium AH-315-K03]